MSAQQPTPHAIHPPVIQPQTYPVVRTGAGEPVPAPAALEPPALATRLADLGWRRAVAAPRTHWRAGDVPRDVPLPLPGAAMPPLPAGGAVGAAVLLLLLPRPSGWHVLLTRRADHLRRHAGQVALPGGRCDPGDTSAVHTALREANEEVGLAGDAPLTVLGALPRYRTITGYDVVPVLAALSGGRHPPWRIDPGEVASVHEVPLAALMNPAHHRWHEVDVPMPGMPATRRDFLSIAAPGAGGATQPLFIWGATAAMLRNLYLLAVGL